jgi:hypothetical protein
MSIKTIAVREKQYGLDQARVSTRDVQTILSDIHRELGRQSANTLFVEGWGELSRTHSPCAIRAYKVSFIVGGILATGFVIGSSAFGCLALKQALDDFHEEEIAPIIGHFSEWTMQALFAGSVTFKWPYEIVRLGMVPKVNMLFDRYIHDMTLSRVDRLLIYSEKLRYLESQAQNNFFSNQQLPDPGIGANASSSIQDLLTLDTQLRKRYQAIERELNPSAIALVKNGWREILRNKSCCYKAAIKAAVIGTGAVVLGQYAIYSMGIYWSAEQAISDYNDNENPSIGGHCLEWAAEMLGVGGALSIIASEIANVGSVKLTVDVFNRHKASLADERPSHWKKKVERLGQVMEGQLRKISRGYFFSLPTHLKFLS